MVTCTHCFVKEIELKQEVWKEYFLSVKKRSDFEQKHRLTERNIKRYSLLQQP